MDFCRTDNKSDRKITRHTEMNGTESVYQPSKGVYQNQRRSWRRAVSWFPQNTEEMPDTSVTWWPGECLGWWGVGEWLATPEWDQTPGWLKSEEEGWRGHLKANLSHKTKWRDLHTAGHCPLDPEWIKEHLQTGIFNTKRSITKQDGKVEWLNLNAAETAACVSAAVTFKEKKGKDCARLSLSFLTWLVDQCTQIRHFDSHILVVNLQECGSG